jgi:hypothetical protein
LLPLQSWVEKLRVQHIQDRSGICFNLRASIYASSNTICIVHGHLEVRNWTRCQRYAAKTIFQRWHGEAIDQQDIDDDDGRPSRRNDSARHSNCLAMVCHDNGLVDLIVPLETAWSCADFAASGGPGNLDFNET